MVGHAEWDAAHCLWIRQPLRGELGSNLVCTNSGCLQLAHSWETHFILYLCDDSELWRQRPRLTTAPALTAQKLWTEPEWRTHLMTFSIKRTSWCISDAGGGPSQEPDELNFQRLGSIKELVRCLLNQNPAVEFKLHNLKRKVYGLKWCWLFFWQCGHNEQK